MDREVVVDGNLVTSRQPSDLPAFNREMTALFVRAGPQTGVAGGEKAPQERPIPTGGQASSALVPQ